jgi:hypothetical protein
MGQWVEHPSSGFGRVCCGEVARRPFLRPDTLWVMCDPSFGELNRYIFIARWRTDRR